MVDRYGLSSDALNATERWLQTVHSCGGEREPPPWTSRPLSRPSITVHQGGLAGSGYNHSAFGLFFVGNGIHGSSLTMIKQVAVND